MTENLQPIGVRAVIEGLPQYINGLNQISQKTAEASKQTQSATTSTSGFDKILGQITSKLSGVTPEAGAASDAMGQIGEVAGLAEGTVVALSAAVAVVAVEVAGFLALAQRGAGFSEIEHGFQAITNAVNVNAEALLTNLHDAVGGTVSDMELLTIVNQTLIGTSKEFGHAFGVALPELMKIAKASAEATGRDVIAVYDQITESIRRGQARGLQAAGVIIDQKVAFDQYAQSIGKTTAELTKQDQEMALLQATLKAGKQTLDTLGQSAESNADKQEKMGVTMTNLFDKLSETVQPIFGVILDALNNLVSGIAGFIEPIAAQIGAIISIIASIVGPVWNLVTGVLGGVIKFIGQVIGNSIGSFAKGGAFMIGALAQGILAGANMFVFPAILFIAQGIADFLIGLSPPPKGPLSMIAEGGANVMQSWITGFTGVSLDPVQEVAAEVNQAMGTVATASLDVVKNRLAQLDAAILPFENRLKIVQSTFDALRPAQEAAFRAIDRQLNAAQQALENGDQSAAALVQHLDAQRAQLQSYVDAQQEAVDNAQIQLSFAQAQQAQERAILEIRQKQIPVTKEAAPKKEKQAGGAAAPTGEELPAGFGAGAPNAPAFDISGIEQAKADIKGAFDTGLGGEGPGSQLALAQENVGKIGQAFDKIGKADIGGKIKESLGNIFDPTKPGSVLYNITTWFEDTFDPGKPTSVFHHLNDIGPNISKALSGIGDIVKKKFNEASLQLTLWYDANFAPDVPTSITFKIKDFVSVKIPEAFKGVEAFFNDNLFTPIQTVMENVRGIFNDIVNRAGTGILAIWQQMLDFVAQIPTKITTLLASLGETLKGAIVNPIISAANSFLGAINTLIRDFIDGLKKLATDVLSHIPGTDDLVGKIKGITVPQFPTIPMAKEGGLFGGGLFSANPREEIIGPADKMAVFPQQFISAVDRLTTVMIHATPAMASMTSNSSTNVNRSINATFNGVGDSGEAMRRLAVMQAYS